MSRRWWEQAGIDLEGAWKQASESTTRSATESEEESDGEPNGIAGGGEAESLTGKQPRQSKYGIWEYPPLAGARKEAGIVGIRTSITKWQNTVAQYIATRPILGLCERAKY